MANRKFSQFTAGGASQVPTDVLVGLDLSQASALQNTKWTLNNLFAKPTLNITDGAMRFGAPGSAPAASSAGEGSIYFDGTQFQVSGNAGAYTPLGDVSGSFTSGQVAYANGTKSLTSSSGFTFAANALTLGTSGTPGGLRLVGATGNYWNLASSSPAGNRTFYFPDSITPTTGNFLFVGTFGATVVADWSTGLTWSNTTKQLTVTAALNDVIGLGVQNTSAGTAAQCQVGFTANGGAISLLSLTGTNFSTSGIYHANQLYWRGTTGITDITFALDDASTNFRFAVNNVVAASINATSTEGLVLGIASSLTGRIKLFNSAGATYTQISAGNAAANLNYILPATSPTAGQFLQAGAPSGGNVTLTWASGGGGGTISGTIANTQVAYGTGTDTIGGNSAFTYISATNVLDVGFSTSGVVQSAQLKSPQITSGTASSITGTLEFYNSSNANLTRFTVGAAASALRYIWPTADPTTGQVLSASAPSGGDVTLSWASSGGGTTINSTDGALPYRVDSTTFGDSGISSNARNSTYLNVTSGASGAGLTLTVAGGGSNENLILAAKGTGSITSSFNYITAGATIGYYTYLSSSGLEGISGGVTLKVNGTQILGINYLHNYALVRSDGGFGWSSDSTLTGSPDTGFIRSAAGVIRATNGSTGASQLLIGTSTDTVSAQLDVRSQSTTRPAARFQAASGTSGSQEMFGVYDGGGIGTFTVLSNGNVGIGTTAPSSKLHVVGTTTIQQIGGVAGTDELQVSHDGTSALFYNPNGSTGVNHFIWRMNNTVSDVDLNLGWQASQGVKFKTSQNLSLDGAGVRLQNSGTNIMHIDTAGVWLDGGLLLPATTGTKGLGNTIYTWGTVYSRALYSDSGQNLALGINGSEKVTIKTDGNVGIGTTSPSQRLTLNSTGGLGWDNGSGTADTILTRDAAAGDAQLFARNEAGFVSQLTGNIYTLDQDYPATTTTLANITGGGIYGNLSANVQAGKSYNFRAVLLLDANATGGWKVAMGGTCTATTFRAGVLAWGTSAGLVATLQVTALGSTTTGSGVNAYEIIIEGYISVNAAGTLTVQFAQNSASGTSYVKEGSYFQCWLSNR